MKVDLASWAQAMPLTNEDVYLLENALKALADASNAIGCVNMHLADNERWREVKTAVEAQSAISYAIKNIVMVVNGTSDSDNEDDDHNKGSDKGERKGHGKGKVGKGKVGKGKAKGKNKLDDGKGRSRSPRREQVIGARPDGIRSDTLVGAMLNRHD